MFRDDDGCGAVGRDVADGGERLGLAGHGAEGSFVLPESLQCNSGFSTEIEDLGLSASSATQ